VNRQLIRGNKVCRALHCEHYYGENHAKPVERTLNPDLELPARNTLCRDL